MKEIHLHGELADKFGKDPIMLEVETAAMITRGLISRFGQEFREIIRNGAFEFLCLKDSKKTYVHDEMTATMMLDADEVHITPVVEGSGKFGQIIMGVVLIVVGAVATVYGQPWGANVSAAGIAMVAGGVVQLLMPSPSVAALSNERPDARPSFVFNGAVNVYEQGGPVPLVYGRFKAGSVIVSAGFDVERIGYNVRCGRRYDDDPAGCPDGPRRGDRSRR